MAQNFGVKSDWPHAKRWLNPTYANLADKINRLADILKGVDEKLSHRIDDNIHEKASTIQSKGKDVAYHNNWLEAKFPTLQQGIFDTSKSDPFSLSPVSSWKATFKRGEVPLACEAWPLSRLKLKAELDKLENISNSHTRRSTLKDKFEGFGMKQVNDEVAQVTENMMASQQPNIVKKVVFQVDNMEVVARKKLRGEGFKNKLVTNRIKKQCNNHDEQMKVCAAYEETFS